MGLKRSRRQRTRSSQISKANTAGAPAPPVNAAVTAVAAAVASSVLLAANAARKGATVYNDSAAELLVRLGTPAAAATFTVDMLPGAYYKEVPFGYTGQVTGIWASATGFARVDKGHALVPYFPPPGGSVLPAGSVDNTALAAMLAAWVKGKALGAGNGPPQDLTAHRSQRS